MTPVVGIVILDGMRVRAPSFADAAAVADLFSRTDSLVTPEVVVRDWERDGFDLPRDAWVWLDGDEVTAFGALYPGGWISLAGVDDGLRTLALDRVLGHVAVRDDTILRVMVPAEQRTFRRSVVARGFHEDVRFSTYRGAPAEPLRAPMSGIEVRSVGGEPDERAIFDLAARAYGDGPDFASWRRWITSWEYDATLWLVATAQGDRVGGLVAFTFPTEGWIKRVAIVEPENDRHVAVALVQRAMRTFAARGVVSVGLPVASDEPDYLHAVAREFSLRLDDERTLFERSRTQS